jgi:hypothetical protein
MTVYLNDVRQDDAALAAKLQGVRYRLRESSSWEQMRQIMRVPKSGWRLMPSADLKAELEAVPWIRL